MISKISLGLRYWLMFAVIATASSAAMFLVVQQALRMNANDPQIQMAEDASFALAKGDIYTTIVPESNVQKIDITKSLAPFLIIYDENGKVVTGTGSVNGEYPTFPTGVFAYTKIHGENRVTWQPSTSTRVALVVRYYSGERTGFVVAGRSMREVEKRISNQFLIIGAGWAFVMIICFFLLSYKGFHIVDMHARRAEDRV